MSIIDQIRAIVEEAATMKNAYFFTSPSSAASRRSYERYHSHPLVEWVEGGHTYTAEFIVSCSCRNVYARGEYTRDGKKDHLNRDQKQLEAYGGDSMIELLCILAFPILVILDLAKKSN